MKDKFSDDCDGCKPAMWNVTTGKAFPDDSLEMQIVFRVWREATSLAEREAWHRFTCQNSTTVDDLRIVKAISDRIQAALLTEANGRGLEPGSSSKNAVGKPARSN